jgi:nucleoside-diphosphate-sugar epimerase
VHAYTVSTSLFTTQTSPFGEAVDVPQTWADVSKAGRLFGYKPTTAFKQGVEKFVEWRSEQLSF